MRIVYHLGAHCTDEERLIRCLLKNRAVLAAEGIAVPPPTRYRKALRDTLVHLGDRKAEPETGAILLEQILAGEEADRLILGSDRFLGPAATADATLYAEAGARVRALTGLFPDHDAELHLAIRNPATFLPAVRDKVLGTVLPEGDPLELRWSGVVRQITAACPDLPLTVWSDEDTPLLWPDILQAVSGHADGTVLADTDELLAMIMSPDGMARMHAYCATHPPANPVQRRRIVAAFLEKFAIPDRIEMEFAYPGWTEDLVTRLTEAYRSDIEVIRAMPDVRFLT